MLCFNSEWPHPSSQSTIGIVHQEAAIKCGPSKGKPTQYHMFIGPCIILIIEYTDQLDVTCFIISLFTAQHVSNVSTSIFRSLRLIVDLFHVLCCSGSKCVGVTVWFGWGGVVYPYAGWSKASACIRIHHTTPAEPHRNTNTLRTRATQHMK